MSSNNTDTKHNCNTAGSSPAPREAHPRADELQLEVFGEVIYAYRQLRNCPHTRRKETQADCGDEADPISLSVRSWGFRQPNTVA